MIDKLFRLTKHDGTAREVTFEWFEGHSAYWRWANRAEVGQKTGSFASGGYKTIERIR